MYEEFTARAEPLFCSLNLLFTDVPVVAILNSLMFMEVRYFKVLDVHENDI